MIEGQEDVTWEDWLALAGACEEHGVGTMFRSDHYLSVDDRRERGSLDAWGTIAALGARHRDAAAGDDGLAGDLPPSRGAGEAGGDRRPRLRRPGRSSGSAPAGGSASTSSTGSSCRRSGRGWTRSRSRCRSSAATGARGRSTSTASTTRRTSSTRGRSRCSGRSAADPRRQRRAAQPAPGGALRRRVQHGDVDRRGDRRPAPAPRRGLRRGGPRPGDLPLSMMTGWLVGADRAELLDRAARLSRVERRGRRRRGLHRRPAREHDPRHRRRGDRAAARAGGGGPDPDHGPAPAAPRPRRGRPDGAGNRPGATGLIARPQKRLLKGRFCGLANRARGCRRSRGSQMSTRTSSTRSSSSEGDSPAKVAYWTRSFICTSAIARSRAGWPARGGAAGALGFDHGGGVGDPALHHLGPEVAGFGVGRAQFGRRQGHRPARPEGAVEVFERLAQAGAGVSLHQGGQCLFAAVGCVGDEAVDDRQHHRVLGGEVEVEGGAGDASAFGEVVDRDLAQRPVLEQPFGGLQDRPLAVVAVGSGAAAAAALRRARGIGGAGFRGGRHAPHDTSCRENRQVVDLLDTLLIEFRP